MALWDLLETRAEVQSRVDKCASGCTWASLKQDDGRRDAFSGVGVGEASTDLGQQLLEILVEAKWVQNSHYLPHHA